MAVIGLIIGGYKLRQQAEYNEMVRIVKSEEVKAIIEEDLNDIHEGALKEGNSIYSYQIDETSIRHNPMGGIIVYLYINDSSSYKVSVFLHKDSDGKLRNGGGSNPSLEKLKGDSN